jgi:hypothetical protein
MDQIAFIHQDCNGEPLKRMPQRLYRFRPLEPFDRIADILLKKRFYAAQFRELNDPMEGMFEAPQVRPTIVKRIRRDARQWRVCCFSLTADNPCLWAYYADGFKGICIEIEVQMTGAPFHWDQVDYKPAVQLVQANDADFNRIFPQNTLRWKAEQWEHEREVRKCTTKQYVPFGKEIKITRILFGLRTPRAMQNVI